VIAPSPQPLSRLEGERGSFGEAATRLSGAVTRLLGWRPDEFWNATPTELAQVLSSFDEQPDPPDAKTIEALRQRFPDAMPAASQAVKECSPKHP
jgi:hypothetical protein